VFHWDRFEFFRKFAETFAAQGLPPVSLTPVANGKNLQSDKILIILFGHLWVVEETYIYKFLPSSVHFQVSAAWYCSHYLPPVSMTLVSLTPVANLPLVSTTQGELVAKFAAGVVDTGGKFATGVVDTGGAPWLANISANFRKNSKWSYCYYQGLGGRWFMKKTWSKKSRDTVPLSREAFPESCTSGKVCWEKSSIGRSKTGIIDAANFLQMYKFYEATDSSILYL
jgi:hypothetical protein